MIEEPITPYESGNTEQSQEPLAVAQDEERIQALFAVMQREQRRERTYRRYIFASGIVMIFSIGLWFVWQHDHKSPAFMAVVQIINFINMLASKMLDSEARQRTIKELARLEDVRAVGPLIDTLSFRAEELKPQVKWTLTMLLPRLQATDAAILNTQRRNTLHKVLMSDNINLIVAILKAYEQVGDSRDLPAVERLVHIKRSVGDDGRVYTSALECLPYLQANIEHERAATTLLRASDAVAATPDTLLRAAQFGTTTSTSELLRIPPNSDS